MWKVWNLSNYKEKFKIFMKNILTNSTSMFLTTSNPLVFIHFYWVRKYAATDQWLFLDQNKFVSKYVFPFTILEWGLSMVTVYGGEQEVQIELVNNLKLIWQIPKYMGRCWWDSWKLFFHCSFTCNKNLLLFSQNIKISS